MEAALLSAAVLACPIGMGLMMWFMAKGMRKDAAHDLTPAGTRPPVNPRVEQLREEHQRLGAELERLENPQANRVLNRS